MILVVGGGKMGLSHAALLAAYIGREEVLVCDSSILTVFLFRCLGFCTTRSVSHAITSRKIDGAIVATPTASHAQIVQKLISAGIPCLVEKPLTLDAKNLMKMS